MVNSIMLSLDKLRKIDPEFAEMSDEQITQLRDALYALIEKALDEVIDSDKMESTWTI